MENQIAKIEQTASHQMMRSPKASEWLKSCEAITISGTETSVRDIRELGLPPLSRMVGLTGSRFESELLISLTVQEIVFFFGATWSDKQLINAAKMLYENYYKFSAADWILFAKMCMSARFGKVYGVFSPSVLMDWAADFEKDWTQEAIRSSMSSHEEIRNKTLDNRVTAEAMKMLKRQDEERQIVPFKEFKKKYHDSKK